MAKSLIALALACSLVGCFFTVKEMTVDPDKGYNHTQKEVTDAVQAAR